MKKIIAVFFIGVLSLACGRDTNASVTVGSFDDGNCYPFNCNDSGTDTGPSPYDFLLAGLGACTAMTLRLYADQKQWPLERVSVRLSHQKIHAADCADCETREGRIDRIEREISLAGALTAEQRARLLEIADKCPVHRTLHSEVSVKTREVAA